MKRLLLPFLLLFSMNLFAEADVDGGVLLDSPVVDLGYLESVNGLPFNHTLTFIRNEDTPRMVDVYFSFTQIEMICADRMPDGGGWGGGYGCGGGCCQQDCQPVPEPDCPTCGGEDYGKSVNKWNGHDGYWWEGSHHSDYGHRSHGFERNWMGICRRWTTLETQKSGRAKIVFKKKFHNDKCGDIIKLNIRQRDLHSTVFWVKGWAVEPNDYRVMNYDRTVIFK